MTCVEAEILLLASLDEALPAPDSSALDGHLAGCADCAAFAESMRTVDERLQLAMASPPVPPALAAGVLAQVRRERTSAARESLPDVIHLAGCTVATVVAAALLPVEASITLAAGIGFTCVSYVGLAVIRWSLETVELVD